MGAIKRQGADEDQTLAGAINLARYENRKMAGFFAGPIQYIDNIRYKSQMRRFVANKMRLSTYLLIGMLMIPYAAKLLHVHDKGCDGTSVSVANKFPASDSAKSDSYDCYICQFVFWDYSKTEIQHCDTISLTIATIHNEAIEEDVYITAIQTVSLRGPPTIV